MIATFSASGSHRHQPRDRGSTAPHEPDLERGEGGLRPRVARRVRPPVSAVAGRAGSWAALRELGAQSAGALAGMAVRNTLETAGPFAATVCGTAAAAGVGLAVYRAGTLIAAASAPEDESARIATQMAVAALPLSAVALGVALAAHTGTSPLASAYLAGKLAQRCVRDLSSSALQGVLPACTVTNDDNVAISKEELLPIDWSRARGNALPTLGYFAAQEFLAPTPPSTATLAQGLTHAAAVGLVEAARAMTGTLTAAALAEDEGHQLLDKAAGGCARLQKNMRSMDTVQQAGDATAMREYFGIAPDVLGAITSHLPPTQRQVVRVLRIGLKALSEFRTPWLTCGQLALQQQASVGAHPPAPLDESHDMLGGTTGVAYPNDEEPVIIHITSASQP